MACRGMDVDGLWPRASTIASAMHGHELCCPGATVELPGRQPHRQHGHYLLLYERSHIREHSAEPDRQPISNHSHRTAERRDYRLPADLDRKSTRLNSS